MKYKIKYIKAWMRDKIVIMEKGAYKTAKRPPVKKKTRRRKKIEKNRYKRELQILEKTNNSPVAISLESTVGSCCVLDMLCLLHSSTKWPEGLEGTLSFWQKSSSGISRKTKRKCTWRAVRSPAYFSLLHRWIMLIIGYVVHLDVVYILDGGDWKFIL